MVRFIIAPIPVPSATKDVGYNTGGIVGRLHQGYLQNCTNTGYVQGRKDVGGIVGQMEPFLEIQYLSDKLKELDTETDKFLDMLDATQKDVSSYSKQASSIAKSISSNLKDANNAGSSLTGTAHDLWHIYNQELNGVSNDLKVLNDDLNKQADNDKNNGNSHDVTISGNDIWNGNWGGDGDHDVSGGNITITVPDDTESYKSALKNSERMPPSIWIT